MGREDITVLKNVEVSFEEKKSIFICNISRIRNEEEAMKFINEIKEKYKDATHNVFAYITNNGISMRYSDDGEPQGTAGPPVLEVLKREGLNDVAVVVTRYFGGTLLGAGGLVRAYSASCKQGVDAAGKVKRKPAILFSMNIEYDKYGKINHYLQHKNVKIISIEYAENIVIRVVSLLEDFDSIHSDIIEILNGNDIINFKDECVVFVDECNKIMEVQNK
ncbi:IMPACT family member YigZ [Caloramator mitchellensis]|uniref:IMPACT family member YigZ n=1 Tax=Caloramator mitchellensis TaxID=908809 RepID=A0A0R3JV76_CALMK|nr:YigZ family protein [Caloramator mitchellensis]KRQ87499.1 IMPACT family member YigZ [Caloramator mitchellensis]